MTGKKTVILVAWDNETEVLSNADRQRLADNNIALLYTGIGKNNANTAARYCHGEYDRVINVGCAGTHTQELETYSRVSLAAASKVLKCDVTCGSARTPNDGVLIQRRSHPTISPELFPP